MQRRDATTTQVLGDCGSMDSVQRSELVNAIALHVSLNEIINLPFVQPNLSLEDSANGHRSRNLNASGRNPRQNSQRDGRKV